MDEAIFLFASFAGIAGIKLLLENIPKLSSSTPLNVSSRDLPSTTTTRSINKLKILYGSLTGTAKSYAETLAHLARSQRFEAETVDLKDYEPESLPSDSSFVIVVISTHEGGLPPPTATFFVQWLVDTSTDFRVHRNLLENVKYAVFALGNSEYAKNYNRVGRRVEGCFKSLAAKQIVQMGQGDTAKDVDAEFDTWAKKLLEILGRVSRVPSLLDNSVKTTNPSELKKKRQERILKKRTTLPPEPEKKLEQMNNTSCSSSNSCCSSTSSTSSPSACCSSNTTTEVKLQISQDTEEDSEEDGEPLVDVEELGALLNKNTKKKSLKKTKAVVIQKKEESEEEEEEEEEDDETEKNLSNGPSEMLNPSLRRALTKQGYHLLGSHSGVKLCRWTKAMLRGRGGCYKHTFYGISSFQCMEMTPSLACANKCVFCWRHHKNPVGKEWRWKVDSPEFLVESAVTAHQSMIKELKGVPGVKPERLEVATRIQHCALSLVGEPILYPHINRFVDLLHEREISTFLVTNAQFPDKIEQLTPVTQLYVSVDAATKDSLKKNR
jgi:tRNA wybutosine-synthesizing protein 1